MSTKYNYDDSGQFFMYFLMSLTCLYLIPSTWYILSNFFKKGPEHDPATCTCSSCASKRKHVKILQKNKRKWYQLRFSIIIWLCAWVFFIFLARNISRITSETILFDPYQILGLDSSADVTTIKKQFKVMSFQFHPDRNMDDPLAEKKFIEISKAYKTLTNDEARLNWEKYGNPDGIQAFSMGIALPTWLVERGNRFLVLGVYGTIFGIVLPIVVGKWWYKSKKYTRDKILNQTMTLYYSELKENITIKKLIDVLTASIEFKEQLKIRPSDNFVLPKLEPLLTEYERSKKYTAPYCIKTNMLIHAYLTRVEYESPFFLEDELFVVEKSLHLLYGMIQMASLKKWLQCTISIIDLSPMLVQSLWNNQSPLLQLPYITQELLRHFKTKKRDIRTIEQLLQMSDEDRRLLLRTLDDAQYEKVLEIAKNIPVLDAEANFKVANEELVLVDSLVNLEIRLIAVNNKDDHKNIEKSNTRESPKGKKIDPVHAPFFPKAKFPAWWVVVGDHKQDRLICWPEKVIDLYDEKIVNMQFQAPPKAGTYILSLYIKSDSYLNCDFKKELKLQVHDASKAATDIAEDYGPDTEENEDYMQSNRESSSSSESESPNDTEIEENDDKTVLRE